MLLYALTFIRLRYQNLAICALSSVDAEGFGAKSGTVGNQSIALTGSNAT